MELSADDEVNTTINTRAQNTRIVPVQGEDQEEAMEALGFDRISFLPDHLAHHIMSFLPTRDATRSSILSKRWEFLWLTFPIIEFKESWFLRHCSETSRRLFLEYMQQNLSRRDWNHIQKLDIFAFPPNDDELDNLVNECIALALRGKVKELHLDFLSTPKKQRELHDIYTLPEMIFSSGSSLVSLELDSCWCGFYDEVNFPSLKILLMRSVHIGNQMLQIIISKCPQLESLKLDSCNHFDTLRIHNPKVKCIVVIGCKYLKAFEIDAQSLKSFRYNGYFHIVGVNASHNSNIVCAEISEFKVPNANGLLSLETLVLSYVRVNDETFFRMFSSFPNLESMNLLNSSFEEIPFVLLEKLKHFEVRNCDFNGLVDVNAPNLESFFCKSAYRYCKFKQCGGIVFGNLKTFSLIGYKGLTDESLHDLLSSCFFLEILKLKSCGKFKHMKIISSTLKSLVIDSCLDLEDGEIHASRLVYFKFVGSLAEFSPMISSCNLDVELHLKNPEHPIGDFELIKLKKLFRNLDQARVLTIVANCIEYVIIPEEKGALPPLFFLRHLRVKASLRDTTVRFLNVLLGVLRISFCRETLLLSVGGSTLELKFQFIPEAEEMDFLFSEWGMHDCIKHHLIEVKLQICDGTTSQIIEMMTYLLHEAELLNSMFISFGEKLPRKAPLDRSEIVSKIMNYPKASQNAQICFI